MLRLQGRFDRLAQECIREWCPTPRQRCACAKIARVFAPDEHLFLSRLAGLGVQDADGGKDWGQERSESSG